MLPMFTLVVEMVIMTVEPLRIAPSRHGSHWTIEDWKSINFSVEVDWQTAINIFEDRIRSRFLNIINQAQPSLVSGFAVMALDCLLIETLQQFLYPFREGRLPSV